MRSLLLGGALLGLALGSAGLALRLCTARFDFSDDPTTGVVRKGSPSWTSRVVDPDLAVRAPLIVDENGFVGEDVYTFVTQRGWWMMLLAGAGAVLGRAACA
jgi:hypothetical protein